MAEGALGASAGHWAGSSGQKAASEVEARVQVYPFPSWRGKGGDEAGLSRGVTDVPCRPMEASDDPREL